jgi:sugar phosphate isomerase/epimerase
MHLSYCTNVHPAEDLDGIVRQFDTYAVAIRRHLDADVLGLGLWLAAPVARELAADPAARRRLRRELDARGLEVVTLNGFPYEAFQAPVVKHAVYQPDWTTRERLDYTLDLARVLVDLLPDGADRGSISTLPLAWRTPWDARRADAAARHLDELAATLATLDRPIRVGFEPEPGCIVETTAQAAAALSGVDTRWLGVCLDLAHLACAWEDPVEALDRLAAVGLPVVKVQVSAALEAADPVAAAEVLRRYVEPRFLHQTRSAARGGCTTTCRCTPTRPRRSPRPCRSCGRRCGNWSGGTPATTSTWRRTRGACCPKGPAPARTRMSPRASRPSWRSPATNC